MVYIKVTTYTHVIKDAIDELIQTAKKIDYLGNIGVTTKINGVVIEVCALSQPSIIYESYLEERNNK